MLNTVWIDIEDPEEEEEEEDYQFLKDKFMFHDLALEYCKNKSVNSKFSEYGNYYFLIITSITKTNSIENAIYNYIIRKSILISDPC